MRRANPRIHLLVLPALLALAVFAPAPIRAGSKNSKTEKSASAKPSQEAPADASEYVGSDTCKTCHEEIFNSFEKTPHWKTTLAKGAVPLGAGIEGHGCESCHGPGKAHVDGGGDKSKIFVFETATAEQISKRCMSCHEYSAEHANFDRSQHNINDVSCISCHSPHHAKEPEFLLVNSQPQLCYGCHTDIKQDFNRPFRHRVEQGLVQCTDCHNQHGGFLTKQLRSTAAQDQVCFKCHTDKAGPFVFEHEPVRTEGCTSCHSPHGSTNPRLLKRAQVNLLCLECHTLTQDSSVPALPTFHNQSQKYQACTLCHVAIHGSNFDATFFK